MKNIMCYNCIFGNILEKESSRYLSINIVMILFKQKSIYNNKEQIKFQKINFSVFCNYKDY